VIAAARRRLTGVVFGGLAACALLVFPAGAQERNVFRSSVDAVRVDALVARGGRPVTDLGAADFTVLDNGVRQRIELVSYEDLPVNVVIALDLSSSLTGQRLAQLRAASASLTNVLKKDDRAALISFNETVTLAPALTTSLDRVRTAVGTIDPPREQRPTALVDALFASMLTAESDAGRGLVVVFSDGVDTGSWLRAEAVLDVAKRSDAIVYAVVTFHEGRDDFLKDLTETTGGTLVEVESSTDIGAVFLRILEEFRHRYLINYVPEGVARDGWHTLKVSASGDGLKVKARAGYWGAR
jgi:VWFA-related protein